MLLRRPFQQDAASITFLLLTLCLFWNGCLGEETCYVCRHEKHFTSCVQNRTVCSNGEVCFTSEIFHPHGTMEYNSGCISEQICNTIKTIDGRTTHAPLQIGNILGRKKRVIDTCFHCCSADGTSLEPCDDHPCAAPGLFSTTPNTTTTTPTRTTTTPTTTTTTSTATHISHTTTTDMPTTTPTMPTTTTTPSTTMPVANNSCNLCNGMPIYICEEYFSPMKCEAGQYFCMNDLVNHKDGSRTLDRRCVTEKECRTQWWDDTSNRQECANYDPNRYVAESFSCSFCCTGSLCNNNIVPDASTLYRPH